MPMKFLHIASALLAAAVAGCGTLSVPGTPETATSLNGFRASHGLNQLRTDGTLAALASKHAADMARRDSLDHDGFMNSPRPARRTRRECRLWLQGIRLRHPAVGQLVRASQEHADPKPHPLRPRIGHFAFGQEILGAAGGRVAAIAEPQGPVPVPALVYGGPFLAGAAGRRGPRGRSRALAPGLDPVCLRLSRDEMRLAGYANDMPAIDVCAGLIPDSPR